MLAPYRAANTGVVGNGLYRLMGDSASPRLPSVEDYARLLVLASARVGSERAAAMFGGWAEGYRIARLWVMAFSSPELTLAQ